MIVAKTHPPTTATHRIGISHIIVCQYSGSEFFQRVNELPDILALAVISILSKEMKVGLV